VQVGDVGTVGRTVQRVIGTLLGMFIVWGIVTQVQSLVAVYVTGAVFGIAASILGPEFNWSNGSLYFGHIKRRVFQLAEFPRLPSAIAKQWREDVDNFPVF
jgi:hypothetical protein